MPTFWPANTVLRLILRRPMQIRPQFETVMVRSWKGYSWSFQGGPRTPTCAFPERPAGALALALALPLPEDLPHESAIVVITFDLVAFSLFRYG